MRDIYNIEKNRRDFYKYFVLPWGLLGLFNVGLFIFWLIQKR